MSPIHRENPVHMVNQAASAEWREDIDALRFATGAAGRNCFMHRLAFRRFLGPAPEGPDCLVFFEKNRDAFLAAAAHKGGALPDGANYNINSRDLDRALRVEADRPAG